VKNDNLQVIVQEYSKPLNFKAIREENEHSSDLEMS